MLINHDSEAYMKGFKTRDRCNYLMAWTLCILQTGFVEYWKIRDIPTQRMT